MGYPGMTTEEVSLLNYLPGEGKQRVLVLETGYSALVSPPDIYIVYLWATEPSVESEHAIRSFVAKFFVMCDKESKPPPYVAGRSNGRRPDVRRSKDRVQAQHDGVLTMGVFGVVIELQARHPVCRLIDAKWRGKELEGRE
ncbi:hypothetical protein M514_26963 [Trichuris suis]|uniref:Uncharacterized protein n=1 Tax=Trichuris suis TaxID=68888 RepID=A0A085MUD1_9BILA|nr:hypothetical protein M514_26963 [Trichuris suis]